MRLLHGFLRANRRLSARLERRLPQAGVNVQRDYEHVVAEHMNARPGLVVVDVGGGKKCQFAKYRRPELETRIVAVDIDPDEMEGNDDVDEKRVADASERLPFGDGEVDLVASRSVLEHLPDTGAFLREAHRVLRPGGVTIHVFPSKWAPFSLANRALPHGLASRLVHFFIPGSKGILGFRTFYDRTYATAMRRVLEESGFEVVEERVRYYQAEYFSFFVPLYAVNALYELAVYRLGLRNLGAAVLVVARKPDQGR